MKTELHQLNKIIKRFLTTYLIVLTVGVGVGLIFLMITSDASSSGLIERWNGTEEGDEFLVQESYPKPLSEMLITTHNHIFGFAFIFLSIGLIFYFNTTVNGFWKSFLMIEPFLSTIVTFGSIWLMRFIDSGFIYLVIISAVLMYTCYFIMLFICLYELNFKKS